MDPKKRHEYILMGCVTLAVWVTMFCLAVFASGCSGGGGGTSTPPQVVTPQPKTTQYYTDYAVMLQRPTLGTFSYGHWRSTLNPDGTFDLWWGDAKDWSQAGVERFSLRNDGWLWLDAYVHQSAGLKYQITTDFAEVNYGDGWKIMNLLNQELTGQPYALLAFDRTYEIRTCGRVLNDPRNLDHRPEYRFAEWCWQARYEFPVNITNPCWLGAGDRTRLAVKQDELWCDTNREGRAWVCTIGDTERAPSGKPNFIKPVYGRYQYIGQGAGHVWQYSYNNDKACLSNSVPTL